MTIILIAAMAKHNIIGNNNALPWHMPADFKHFKATTLGKPVVMGRLTYESMGKPLPGRENIIISSNADYQAPGCLVFTDLKSALTHLQDQPEIYIIGGAKLFELSMPIADKMILTFIHADIDGDRVFPAWPVSEWQEVDRIDHAADNKNPFPYSFVTFIRK